LDLTASFLAATLFPVIFRTELGGPIKVIPAFSQASAKSGFSERNPYPDE
jgi:hypothetical protein